MDTNEMLSDTSLAAAEVRGANFDTEGEREKQPMTEFICPECQKAGIHASYDDRRGLSSHRRFKHGVSGSSSAVVSLRMKKLREEKEKRKGKPGRPKGPSKKLPVVGKPHLGRRHAALPKKPAAIGPPEFSPSLLGYAAAKLESLAEQIARENNLPEKEFARQVMAAFAVLVQL